MTNVPSTKSSNETIEDDYMSSNFILTAQKEDDNRNKRLNKRRNRIHKRSLYTQEKSRNNYNLNDNNFDLNDANFAYDEPLSKRRRKMKNGSNNRKKKKHILENEQRDIGLNRSISEHNIGYQLLSKMGYKKNTVLEKELNKPVSIQIRQDKKAGLGKLENEQRKVEKLNEKIKNIEKTTLSQFKDNARNNAKFQQLTKKLIQARRTCMSLDEKCNIVDNKLWGIEKRKIILNQETNETIETNATSTTNKNNNDNKEKNKSETETGESESESEIEYIEEMIFPQTLIELENEMTLLLTYLRKQHYYCLWCGIKYKNNKELNQQCAGLNRRDHDCLEDL